MSENAKPGLIILVCGILGLIMAAIEQLAYDSEYFITIYITDISLLPGFQIATIVLFLLIGAVIAALTSR
jgi:hypothetical protein